MKPEVPFQTPIIGLHSVSIELGPNSVHFFVFQRWISYYHSNNFLVFETLSSPWFPHKNCVCIPHFSHSATYLTHFILHLNIQTVV
jgi:hypothetical protein